MRNKSSMRRRFFTYWFLIIPLCVFCTQYSEADLERARIHKDLRLLTWIGFTDSTVGLQARRLISDFAVWDDEFHNFERIEPILKRALMSGDRYRILNALDIIGRIADSYARGVSVRFLGREAPPFVRNPFYLSLIPVIAQVASSEYADVRENAVILFSTIYISTDGSVSQEHLRVIIRALEQRTSDEHVEVRKDAFDALIYFNSAAVPVPHLKEIARRGLMDENEYVREMAEQLLSK